MGFRFRRSIKIAPGVRINLSKSGVSTPVGARGATVNLRGDRVRELVGIPGTGLSYREEQRISSANGGAPLMLALVAVFIIAFFLIS